MAVVEGVLLIQVIQQVQELVLVVQEVVVQELVL
jgi:hypothetical protein